MYKSLIVDDEKNIRNRLAETFPWSELGFSSVVTAKNGKEALEKIKQNPPDIVLTDIMMPVMNGLELAKEINKTFPQIKVVVLSAYDDFKYAQEAIQYRVKGYLLKPLIKGDFYDLMKQLVDELEKERNADVDNLDYIEQMLLDLTKGVELEEYQKNWLAGYYRIIICAFHGGMNKRESVSRFRQKVKDYLNHFFEGRKVPFLFYSNHLIILIKWDRPISKLDIHQFVSRFHTYLEQAFSKMIQGHFLIGVGNLATTIEGVADSYNQAIYAYSYNFFNTNKKIVYYQDLEPRVERQSEQAVSLKKIYQQEVTNLYQDFVDAILERNNQKVSTLVADYIQLLLRTKGENVAKVRQRCYALVLMITLKLKEKGYTLPSIIDDQINQQINQIQSLDELSEYLQDMIQVIATDVEKHDEKSKNDYVIQAKKYVEKHYQEKITLKEMAEKLYLHQSYFSTIFKNETNQNFINYVNDVRVNKAKELIESTTLTMNEISSKVGFQSHSYFNKVFKKVTGISPLMMRKK